MLAQALSSILRFLFIPICTKIFRREEFGIASFMQVNICSIGVIFTFGLSIGFMIRYYKDNEVSLYLIL
jgi:O-antigen/teichoic acid export membrane protein